MYFPTIEKCKENVSPWPENGEGLYRYIQDSLMEFYRANGRKGGQKRGETKVRGGSEHYSMVSKGIKIKPRKRKI